MKITIIGPSAGGKSELARRLSEKFSLPRLELDRLWFKHDGDKIDGQSTAEEKAAVNSKIREEVEAFISGNQNWVSEGTYSKLQPFIAQQADQVVLIQRPLAWRMLSHVARVLRGKNRHPEVTTWQDLKFSLRIYHRWKRDEQSKLDEIASEFKDKVVILNSFREIDQYFDSVQM